MSDKERAIDLAIDKAIDGAAMVTLGDKQLEKMNERIVAIFERELAEMGYRVIPIEGH